MKRKLYHGAAYYPELWDERDIDRYSFKIIKVKNIF